MSKSEAKTLLKVRLAVTPDEAMPEGHRCALPLPTDPTLSEGHQCECGRRWAYLPAHWQPLMTIAELRERQRYGDYARGLLSMDPP